MMIAIEIAPGISNEELTAILLQLRKDTNLDLATYIYTRTQFGLNHDDALAFAGQLTVGWNQADGEIDAERLEEAFTKKDLSPMFQNVMNALEQFRWVFSDPKFSPDCHAQLLNVYLSSRVFYSHDLAIAMTVEDHFPA